jgi:hypothetical protein
VERERQLDRLTAQRRRPRIRLEHGLDARRQRAALRRVADERDAIRRADIDLRGQLALDIEPDHRDARPALLDRGRELVHRLLDRRELLVVGDRRRVGDRGIRTRGDRWRSHRSRRRRRSARDDDRQAERAHQARIRPRAITMRWISLVPS